MAPPLEVRTSDLTKAGGALKDIGAKTERVSLPEATLAAAMPGTELGAIDLNMHVEEAAMACGGRVKELSDLMNRTAAGYSSQEEANTKAMGQAANSLSQVGDFNGPRPTGS